MLITLLGLALLSNFSSPFVHAGCCQSSNWIAHPSGLRRLEVLLEKDAHGNWMPSSLDHIDLSGLKISDEGLSWIISHFPKLTSLNLSGQRRITFQQAQSLASLIRLRSLDLSDTLLDTDLDQFLMKGNPKLLITRRDYFPPFPSLPLVVQSEILSYLRHPSKYVRTNREIRRLRRTQTRYKVLPDHSVQKQLTFFLEEQNDGTFKPGQLRDLDLRGSNISHKELRWIVSHFPNLRSLNLENARTNEGAPHLAGLTHLIFLNLRGTAITDAGLQHLAGMRHLTSLDLTLTKVTDAGLQHLAGMTNLTSLNLNYTGITNAGLQHLAGMTNLTSLSLNCTDITNAGLQHLEGMSHLTSLELWGENITDAGLQNIAGLTHLTSLTLWHTNITDAGLQYLAGMTDITFLNLYTTNITDAGLQYLAGMTNLTFLNLGVTGITDAGLQHLEGMTHLTFLYLASTNVTPAGLRNSGILNRLKRLYFQNKSFNEVEIQRLIHSK